MNAEELMEKYLLGSLAEDELTSLKNLAANDPDTAEDWDTCQFQKQVMQEINAQDLLSKMEQWDKDSRESRPFISLKSFIGGIAVLLLTVSAVFFLLRKPSPTAPAAQGQNPEMKGPAIGPEQEKPTSPTIDTPEKGKTISPKNENKELFKPLPKIDFVQKAVAYYEAQSPVAISFRGGQNEKTDSEKFKEIDEAYRQKDLGKAIELTKSLALTRPNASRLQLLLGKLYFETKDYEQAISVLKPIAEKRSLFASEARWNLLLGYLALHDRYQQEFKTLLDKILSDQDHFEHEKAVQLKKELSFGE